MKSHTGYRLVPKSETLNDLQLPTRAISAVAELLVVTVNCSGRGWFGMTIIGRRTRDRKRDSIAGPITS